MNFDRNGDTFADPDPITFAIPGMGVRTIMPLSALPTITDPVLIDGYTQPGAMMNSSNVGWNGVLLIELNGSMAGAGVDGLHVTAGGSTVLASGRARPGDQSLWRRWDSTRYARRLCR